MLRPRPLPLLLIGALCTGLGVGFDAPARAIPPSPSQLQALEKALNARDDAPLAALLRSGPGLDSAQLRQRRQLLRQSFPDLSWRVKAGPPLRDGQPTVAIATTGSRILDGSTYRLEAQQILTIESDGRQLLGEDLLSETSLLRSGEKTVPVVLQAPDAVLTGQRYDVDLIVDEPLDGALLAGGITAVSPAQVAAMASPPLELGALGGGGLFKTVRAPLHAGLQTWALLLVHPRAIITATKRVRVVADRRALTP
jgi:hypothetical protein